MQDLRDLCGVFAWRKAFDYGKILEFLRFILIGFPLTLGPKITLKTK